MEKLLKSMILKIRLSICTAGQKVLSSSIFIPIKRMGFKVLVTMHDYFLQCSNGCAMTFKRKRYVKEKH